MSMETRGHRQKGYYSESTSKPFFDTMCQLQERTSKDTDRELYRTRYVTRRVIVKLLFLTPKVVSLLANGQMS